MELTCYTRIKHRNSLGQFLSSIPEKARRSIEETAKGGADVGRARATVKTGAMRGSVQAVIFSDWSGGITVGTDHWKYQNDGTGPHEMSGDVTFYWEKRGQPWYPGHNTINHPGNPAVHFMDAAADYSKTHFMDAVRRNFA